MPLQAVEQAAQAELEQLVQVHLHVAVDHPVEQREVACTGDRASASRLKARPRTWLNSVVWTYHEAAFGRYAAEMRDYVTQCQTLPPGGVKGFAPDSALMIRMRNLSMAMMTRWPMRALVARQFKKADAITLKDY